MPIVPATAGGPAAGRDKADEYLRRGQECLRRGEPQRAAAWFGKAMGADSGDAPRMQAHRLRIRLALGRSPRLVGIWDGSPEALIVPPSLSRDGRKLVRAILGGVEVIEAMGASETRTRIECAGTPSQIQIAPGGDRILVAVPKAGVFLYGAKPENQYVEIANWPGDGVGVAPEGRAAWVSNTRDASVHLINVENGMNLCPVVRGPEPECPTISCAFDGEAGRLAATLGRRLTLMEVATGRRIADLDAEEAWAGCLASDGGHLIAWTASELAMIELKSGRVMSRSARAA